MKKNTLVLLITFQIGMAQDYTEFLTGSATDLDVTPETGTVLMGGATESDEAMQWFLNKANGGDVVVIRTSGSDGYNNYFYSQLGVTINSVRTFVISNANGATDPYVIDKIEKAEAIWFAGGNQATYVSYFKDNAMETALNNHINVKQGVIGGTSAGMAILGSFYFSAFADSVTSTEALNNPYNASMSIGHDDFLSIPYLENLITDTHYDNPDRRGRQVAFMARRIEDNGTRAFGIASEEYTAVCVDENGRAYVFGDHPNFQDFAYFLQSNCATNYAPETCTTGTPLDWVQNGQAVQVYKVPGTTAGQNYFDLTDWTTGNGGAWERWYVTNGSLVTTATTNPNCSAVLSVNEFDIEVVTVHPNPFVDVINVSKNAKNVELFDVSGKVLPFKQNNQSVDTKSLASGIYFLRVSTENTSETFKLIKK